ncbi:MAG: glutamate--tRNA ligase [Planctomycetota bacterium]|nr:glutamate--tRNA ligase [Planctomycetota bacterium]MDA1114052.1 glutamate--tRNA ligase [Planctomycetota bacterium]
MTESRPVRVRFAPSPTGMLHIGGARTALFNWAYARSRGGTFLLRIEDTDIERNSEESLQSILDSMRWLGLDWDEGPEADGNYGPYFQSQRVHTYQAAMARGVEEGWLYRCFASAEELEVQREAARAAKTNWRFDPRFRDLSKQDAEARHAAGEKNVLRFRVPEGEEIVIKDHIRGAVAFSSNDMEDWVAVRPNGMPTYNFVCALDDSAMEISHVIRGEEHLVNTPKQVLVYRALGLAEPEYAHVPLILGQDGKKLSKRTGDTALGDYITKGYPVDALFNFLCLLGFSIDDKTDVFTREELLQVFDLKRISKSGAIFDTDKLHWLCGDWIRRMATPSFTAAVLPYLIDADLVSPDASADAELQSLVSVFQERITLFSELPAQAAGMFGELPEYDQKAQKALQAEGVSSVLQAVAKAVDASSWPMEDFSATVKTVAEELGLGMGKVMKPVRAALTGTLGGPELADVVRILGKKRSMKRLQECPSALEDSAPEG